MTVDREEFLRRTKDRVWFVTYPPEDECLQLYCRNKREPNHHLCLPCQARRDKALTEKEKFNVPEGK